MGKKGGTKRPKREPQLTDNPIALYESIVKDFLDMMMRLLQIVIELETVLHKRRTRRLEGLDSVSSLHLQSESEEGGESEEKEEDEEASPPGTPLPVPSPERPESGETAKASAHDLLVQPAGESEGGVREATTKRQRTN